MGFGIIIVVAVLAGGFFLGWHNILLGLVLFPAKARFTRSDAADGATVFDVTPARASRAVFLIFLLGLWLMWSSFGMRWSSEGGSGHLVLAFSLIPLLLGLLFLPIGARDRKRTRIVVSSAGVSTGGRSWPIAEIAGLAVRKRSRRGEEQVGSLVTFEPGTGAVYGGKPTGALVAKNLGGRMADRSYLLMLRSTRGSKEEVLSGGLTRETALALRDDVVRCINAAHVS